MLVIRPEQMAVFERGMAHRFEDEMVAHGKAFSPRLSEVLGEDQLRVAIRSAIARAGRHGFTLRGPIRLFVELSFLWGSGFDTDPQYPAVGALLRAGTDEMERAMSIHAEFLHYLERVSGEGAANVRRALRELSAFARRPTTYSSDGLVAAVLEEMARAFPQKVDYVGESGLRALIGEGLARSERYGFSTPRQATLVVVLMFAFGHGCTDDPLYPWISRTLNDDRVVSAAARADRLERKATTWLDHVLARFAPGPRA